MKVGKAQRLEIQLEWVNWLTKWVLLVLGSSLSTANTNRRELITGKAQTDPSVSFWESCQAFLSKGSLYHSCALYVKSSDAWAQSNPWVRAQKRAGVTPMAFIYCKWRNGSCLWQGNISEGRQRVGKNQTCVSTKLNLRYKTTRQS